MVGTITPTIAPCKLAPKRQTRTDEANSHRRGKLAPTRRTLTDEETFPNLGNGDGRHQNAPADGRRLAQMYVAEQLPDGRRQLEPEESFSAMHQFSDMRQFYGMRQSSTG